MPKHLRARGPGRGLVLVELLVVVIVLGVLAAAAIPMFTASSENSKKAALDQDLAVMNKAIELYRTQHNSTYPGTLNKATTWQIFVQQMTQPTNRDGAPGNAYGPYLRTGIPSNPYTGTNKGRLKTAIVTPGAVFAWVYDSDTGEICSGTDSTQLPAQAEEGQAQAQSQTGSLPAPAPKGKK